MLLAVPNVSDGRDPETLSAVGDAIAGAPGARLLDVHSDGDHDRSVFTLAAPQGVIAGALLAGGAAAVAHIDLARNHGVHPHVGALDIAPVVYLSDADRGAACAEALLAADVIARELDVPVFLYGDLAGGRTRADLRRGGPAELADRMQTGELTPDFGPRRPHPTAGVTLVAARPPLVAFNVVLAAPATVEDARAIAAAIREGGDAGLEGVRALGVELATAHGAAQVTCNVEDPRATPLAALVAAIGARAEIDHAELVGLAPTVAFEGFPEDIPLPGFDPARHLIENALAP